MSFSLRKSTESETACSKCDQSAGNSQADDIILASQPQCDEEESKCFHCQQTLSSYSSLYVDVDGEKKPVCCHGCKSVVEWIEERDLAQFYTHRDGSPAKATERQDRRDWSKWNQVDDYVQQDDQGLHCLHLQLEGIYCSSCNWLIEKAIADVDPTASVRIDLRSGIASLRVASTASISIILQVLENLGYSPTPIPVVKWHQSISKPKQEYGDFLRRIAVSGIGMMQVMSFSVGTYYTDIQADYERFFILVSMLVATAVVFYAGRPFFINALTDLSHRRLGMDVPIALALAGAYFPSVYIVLANVNAHVYFDSAVMFVFFITLARFVDMSARQRLQQSSSYFHRFFRQSIEVTRLNEGISERLEVLPSEVQIGDRVELDAATTVAIDARIEEGTALVDESMLSGEAEAVLKQEGDMVFAGTRMLRGQLKLTANSAGEDTVVVRIENLLAEGDTGWQAAPDWVRWLNRYFVVAILVTTALVMLYWWLQAPQQMLGVTLAMLIAACPCAFALAYPVGRSAARHRLRKAGVLLMDQAVLNKLPYIDTWCFDKTGTLTEGMPSIVDVKTLDDMPLAECLGIMASIQQHSHHVLSRAFRGIEAPYKPSEIREQPGLGMTAAVNGTQYWLGSRKWIETECGIDKDSWPPSQGALSEILLADAERALLVVAINDQPKQSALRFIQYLRQQHDDNELFETILMSGDQSSAVSEFGKTIEFDQSYAQLLPADKHQMIVERQERGKKVAMFGDGINDAPALKQADVAIVPASASELSRTRADVVLLSNDWKNLGLLLDVSQKMHQVTRQNVFWAILYNCLILPIAAMGLLTPWLAALGMSISSLLVVANAFRIKGVSWK